MSSQMPPEVSRCTAGDIATIGLYTLPSNMSAVEAHTNLADRGFDVAPVVDDESPRGYVERDELPSDGSAATVDEYTHDITLQDLIDPRGDFETTLEALYDQPRYFIGSQNSVRGIVTRADLNGGAARVHLFTYISKLEEKLRTLIQDEEPDWKTTIQLHPEEVDRIEQRYQEARQNNVELPEIHYAQFSTLETIISQNAACWQACGFDDDQEAEQKLGRIVDLRNDVVHSNLVIQNTDRGMLEEGRTVTKLIEEYTYMRQLLSRLAEQLEL